MSRSTISTFQLFEMFPDAETARVYLESRLWPNGPRCPVCGSGDRITVRKRGFYRCNRCKEDFTVRTGTIFERSHVPLHKWVYAMYLVVTARKGISSMQLAKEIRVTQKTAWFVLGRLREACKGNLTKLRGIIEIDETFVGGLEANKHEPKRRRQGRGPVGKQAVLGMRERETGRTRGVLIGNTDAEEKERRTGCASLTSLAASEASASVSAGLECEPSPSAKSSRIANESLKPGGPASLSSRTCERLPPNDSRQMELLPTLSQADFRARTSHLRPQIVPLVLLATVRDYGKSSRAWLARYVHNLQSWRTAQTSLPAEMDDGSVEFSGTWPRSGTMQSGIAYRLPPLVPTISVTGCGLWPTPRASDRDNCGGANARRKAQKLGTYVGRNRNPELDEWLMMFPIGWTDLKPSETQSCP